jgi:hypothetical protein
MMDFVFSESEDGGIYDNRDGMDYHIPVLDSVAKEPPMHIVHIAVEMAPIAKVVLHFSCFVVHKMMALLDNDQYQHRLEVLVMLLPVFHELFKI